MATALPQRIDYRHLADGSVEAKLTITLPDGTEKVFVTTASDNDISGDEIGSLFSFVKRAVKSVAHVARHIATSKLFKFAAIGLSALVPGAGPLLAGGLIAAASSLGVAGKLAHAALAHKHGATDLAQKLTMSAHADAQKLTGGDPVAARALLTAANKKRLAAETLASSPPAALLPPAARSSPATAPQGPMLHPSVASAAAQGRIRSNSGAPVSPAELAAAHAQGRIYWVLS
jgi:hypothetical protein